jgi:hypothetical protein
VHEAAALELGSQGCGGAQQRVVVVRQGLGFVEVLVGAVVVEEKSAHGCPLEEEAGFDGPQKQQAV